MNSNVKEGISNIVSARPGLAHSLEHFLLYLYNYDILTVTQFMYLSGQPKSSAYAIAQTAASMELCTICQVEDNKKVYTITPSGISYLNYAHSSIGKVTMARWQERLNRVLLASNKYMAIYEVIINLARIGVGIDDVGVNLWMSNRFVKHEIDELRSIKTLAEKTLSICNLVLPDKEVELRFDIDAGVENISHIRHKVRIYTDHITRVSDNNPDDIGKRNIVFITLSDKTTNRRNNLYRDMEKEVESLHRGTIPYPNFWIVRMRDILNLASYDDPIVVGIRSNAGSLYSRSLDVVPRALPLSELNGYEKSVVSEEQFFVKKKNSAIYSQVFV